MINTPVVLQPVVSEKSFAKSENGVYTFRVALTSDKRKVKEDIEKRFKVTVEKINMLNRKGKRVFDNRRGISGKRMDSKIAVVTLKAGDTIDVFK